MKVAEDLDVKRIGFDKWLSILERQDPDIKIEKERNQRDIIKVLKSLLK